MVKPIFLMNIFWKQYRPRSNSFSMSFLIRVNTVWLLDLLDLSLFLLSRKNISLVYMGWITLSPLAVDLSAKRIAYANSLDADQAQQNVWHDLRSKLFGNFCKNEEEKIIYNYEFWDINL